MVGVAAAGASSATVATAGVAAIAAGAFAMAVGEYVSVSSQADIEAADEALEREHLARHPEAELEELTQALMERGLSRETAMQAALEMTEHDALDAHLREELGRHEHNDARPVQAALASAASFLTGGFVPFLALATPEDIRVKMMFIVTFIGLGGAGTFSGIASGMNPVKPTVRVIIGGLAAMIATYAVGSIFHTTVA
jgi:VIT1/CCC1 family predicted Fe2+/Mn2+ transporter